MNKLPEFKTTFIEREVAGANLRFYPARFKTIQRLRAEGGALLSAVMQITAPDADPGGSETIENTDTHNGVHQVVSKISPIPLAVLEHQEQKRIDAAKAVFDAFTDESARALIFSLLLDSLRLAEDEHNIERLAETEVPTIFAMLAGWAEAQVGIPFVQQGLARLHAMREKQQSAPTQSSKTGPSGSGSSTPSTPSSATGTPSPTLED